jgi:hypothetical protein
VTDAVEFDVGDVGTPRLDGQEESSAEEVAPQPVTTLAVVVGWTPEEASKVVGGLVANITLALYLARHHAPPPVELWPFIAGDPVSEFPLLGTGLAPVLDFVAPKGSPAAVGVSLGAGAGELIGAFARRAQLLDTAPAPQGRPAAPASATRPAEPAAAAANGDGRGFRFSSDQLRVIEDGDSLAGLGLQ